MYPVDIRNDPARRLSETMSARCPFDHVTGTIAVFYHDGAATEIHLPLKG